MLRIALPNGTLEGETLRFLEKAGIIIPREGRKLKIPVTHHLIKEAWIARPQHIPELVMKHFCEVGICGMDWVAEAKSLYGRGCIEILMTLPYGRPGTDGKAQIVLFCAEDHLMPPERVYDIISEYPLLTKRYFWEKYREHVYPHQSYGTTEVMVPYPYEYGVCLVETGRTLKENRLKAIETIMETRTVMIVSRGIKDAGTVTALKELLFPHTLDALSRKKEV